MTGQSLSRLTLDEFTTDSRPRRSSDPLYLIKRNKHHDNDNTSGTCRCGGEHHGCGCGCKTCGCRLIHFKDESNSEAYGGEGGRRQGVPGPGVDLPDRGSRFDLSSSSVGTAGSLNNGSFDNSYEARGHFDGHHMASANINGVGNQFSASEDEDDGENAWRNFISPNNSLDHLYLENEDSSGMIMPGIMDGSMLAARGSSIEVGERSLLNSEYESSFTQPSATASQTLTGAGAAFEQAYGQHFVLQPLRLTPECRHTINIPICARCLH